MFAVKCKLGKEKEVVISLLNKFFFYCQTANSLRIYSASHIEKFPGYIYIEADNEAQVRIACKDLNALSFGNANRHYVTIVPIKEVIGVFKPDLSKNYDVKEK
jgi:transcription elongation factor SPT5